MFAYAFIHLKQSLKFSKSTVQIVKGWCMNVVITLVNTFRKCSSQINSHVFSSENESDVVQSSGTHAKRFCINFTRCIHRFLLNGFLFVSDHILFNVALQMMILKGRIILLSLKKNFLFFVKKNWRKWTHFLRVSQTKYLIGLVFTIEVKTYLQNDVIMTSYNVTHQSFPLKLVTKGQYFLARNFRKIYTNWPARPFT